VLEDVVKVLAAQPDSDAQVRQIPAIGEQATAFKDLAPRPVGAEGRESLSR